MSVASLNQLYIRRFLADAIGGVTTCDSIVLDLGCGGSPYKDIYLKETRNVVSADLSTHAGIDVCLTAERLPFANEAFDIVVLTEVLEHVRSPQAAISEVSRVLKPGGKLVLTAPFLYGVHEQPHDFQRYTEFGLRLLLEAHNFKLGQLERRGNIIDVFCVVLCHIALMGAEGLTRLPVAGMVFRPIRFVVSVIANVIVKMLFRAASTHESLRPSSPGAGLTGRGHLALWTLGYNILAEREAHCER